MEGNLIDKDLSQATEAYVLSVSASTYASQPLNDDFLDQTIRPGSSFLPLTDSELITLGVSVVGGAVAAFLLFLLWGPQIISSLLGAEPKVYWYLSRSSAFVSFILLWISMASGLLISSKLARTWPGAFTAFDLHQYTSLLGLAFALFHALILLGDQYIGFGLADLIVPFAGAAYRPLWVGLGQIGFYLSVLVSFTFYIRRQIGTRAWRLIHALSFGLFGMALAHGILSGTDTPNAWVAWMYWLAGVSMVALTAYRVLVPKKRPIARVYRAAGGAGTN